MNKENLNKKYKEKLFSILYKRYVDNKVLLDKDLIELADIIINHNPYFKEMQNVIDVKLTPIKCKTDAVYSKEKNTIYFNQTDFAQAFGFTIYSTLRLFKVAGHKYRHVIQDRVNQYVFEKPERAENLTTDQKKALAVSTTPYFFNDSFEDLYKFLKKVVPEERQAFLANAKDEFKFENITRTLPNEKDAEEFGLKFAQDMMKKIVYDKECPSNLSTNLSKSFMLCNKMLEHTVESEKMFYKKETENFYEFFRYLPEYWVNDIAVKYLDNPSSSREDKENVKYIIYLFNKDCFYSGILRNMGNLKDFAKPASKEYLNILDKYLVAQTISKRTYKSTNIENNDQEHY